MNKQTSIYLNLVRFMAATVVFLCHVSGSRFTGGMLWQFGPYGDEAVDIFFVLSGFVIAYVTDGRETTARQYTISRAARIYSVAAPALVVTFILDAIGRSVSPNLYGHWWGYDWHGRSTQFLSCLVFINQIWYRKISPGSNLSFWSLGFEIWYYVIFGVILFARGWARIIAVGATLIFMGPKIDALFPIWLMGAASYYFCAHGKIRPFLAKVLCTGPLLAWAVYENFAWHYGRPAVHTLLGTNLIIQDYIVGSLFTIHLIGFRFLPEWPGQILFKLKRPINWIAGATFTMYLFHLPVAQFLAAETPWPAASLANRIIIFLGTPVIIFAIAEVTERQKDGWRRLFERMLPPQVKKLI